MLHAPDSGTVADWCALFKSACTWTELLEHWNHFKAYPRPEQQYKIMGPLFLEIGVPLYQVYWNGPDGQAERAARIEEHTRKQYEASQRFWTKHSNSGFTEVSQVFERGKNP
jgi:hypothetical protein